MLKINDASNFRRSVAGLCLILGPVLIGVGGQVQPGPEVEGAPYLDAVAAAPGKAELSVLLNYLGFLVFAVGVMGAIHIVRGKGVVLAHIGGGLAVAGLISLTALSITSLYDIAIAENAPREIGVAVFDAPEGYTTAIVLLVIALLGTAIGLVILGRSGEPVSCRCGSGRSCSWRSCLSSSSRSACRSAKRWRACCCSAAIPRLVDLPPAGPVVATCVPLVEQVPCAHEAAVPAA